jgi:hypothetical protein
MDLHLELTGSRVRARLEAALRDAVAGGRLPRARGCRPPASLRPILVQDAQQIGRGRAVLQ